MPWDEIFFYITVNAQISYRYTNISIGFPLSPLVFPGVSSTPVARGGDVYPRAPKGVKGVKMMVKINNLIFIDAILTISAPKIFSY